MAEPELLTEVSNLRGTDDASIDGANLQSHEQSKVECTRVVMI